MSNKRKWKVALDGRSDLKQYGHNQLLLFALQLHEAIDDIHLVAAEYLTDGRNDKKCDLVYIDSESGKVIIAQGYWSDKVGRASAPGNKASDLNTACAWIFGKDFDGMPGILQAAAEEIDSALEGDVVSSVEIWYVHNLPESENVKRELAKVEQTAHAAVKRNYPDCNVESISAKEVGLESLETWYEGTQAPILVTETFSFETRGGYTTSGNKWEAYSTSVPAEWLRDKYNEFGRDLFSANIRDYLGSRRSDRNINNNIKETAKTKPEMFWVFNNGITALVNGFAATSEDESGLLEISGIAIVNGAQTTGALGSVPEADLARAFVPARFVKCDDPQTVQQIIRYNNSQNKIEAADFRSKDLVQTRLRREFTKIPNVEYAGGRRGGAEDSIKRPKNVLQSYTAGQALAAFHGEPAIAYNQKSKIWQSDAIYSRFFHERTGAQHLLFAYSLLKAVESEKVRLKSLDETDRTKQQSEQWETLRKRGATFLLTSAVAASMETILGRSIADHFSLRFSSKKNLGACLGAWEPIVAIGLSFAQSLSEALSRSNLYNKELVRKHLRDYAMHIQALSKVNSDAFERFAVKVKGD